jgi:hypothetical protein
VLRLMIATAYVCQPIGHIEFVMLSYCGCSKQPTLAPVWAIVHTVNFTR